MGHSACKADFFTHLGDIQYNPCTKATSVMGIDERNLQNFQSFPNLIFERQCSLSLSLSIYLYIYISFSISFSLPPQHFVISSFSFSIRTYLLQFFFYVHPSPFSLSSNSNSLSLVSLRIFHPSLYPPPSLLPLSQPPSGKYTGIIASSMFLGKFFGK